VVRSEAGDRALTRRRVVALGLLITMLGGCESIAAPYPADWPPLSNAGVGCRSVAGAYAQHGDRAPGGWSTTPYGRLTWLATGHELQLVAVPALFSFPERDAFEIRAGSDVRRWSLRDGEVACGLTGRLEFRRRSYTVELIPFGPQWRFQRVSFARLHDGSLVAEYDEVYWLLVFFVIPMRAHYVDWYRYPAAASP